MIPAAPATLVGRDAECSRLLEAIAADGTALVTGEPGIGKTALVRHAIALTGRDLVAGAGFATLASTPYLALRLALGAPVTGTPTEVARRVEAALGDGVLFLDDVQWIDHETLAVVPLLAGRIALVLAARDGPATVLESLPPGAVARIRLAPLGQEHAEAVARRIRADLPAEVLRPILERAAGNPLLIEELVTDGRESPTVARAIAARVASASPEARQALRLLAIADHPLPARLLEAVRAELLDLGLVVETGGGTAMAIRHALIAEALRADLSADDRMVLHGILADAAVDEADAAHHLAGAGRRREAVAAALAALDRTTDARRRAALLRIAAEASDGPEALERRIAAARSADGIGDNEAVVSLLRTEPDVPEGRPGQEAAALRRAMLGRALASLGQLEEAAEAFDQVERLDPDPSWEAVHIVVVERTVARANAGDLDGARALLDAVDEQDRSGNRSRRVTRDALRAVIAFLAGGKPDVAGMHAAVEDALNGSVPAASGRALNLHAMLLGSAGPAEALRFASSCIPRVEGAGLDGTHLRTETIQTLAFTGRAGEAVLVADELLEHPTSFMSRGRALTQRAEALCLLGRFAEAEGSLAKAEPMLRDEWSDRGEAATARAGIAYWSGRPREAVAAAEVALAMPVHYAANYLLPALTRAWAQADLGVPPAPLPEAPASWLERAARAEWTALAAFSANLPAFEGFDAAAALWNGHHVLRAGVCRWAAGESARRALCPDAVTRLQSALDVAERHELEPLAARIRRSLRLAGVRVRRAAPRSSGVGLLTAREREILELVALGMANIEIARRMGLGRPTVARTLSNAMAKLGADSRAQAVSLARDLLGR